MTQILILGGGPAGGAVALGMKALGYDVTLVTEARPFDAVEGISDRVIQGLRHAGFREALTCLPQPSARSAHWNGETNSANTESLIERKKLDAGILQDLEAAGVHVIRQRVRQVQGLVALNDESTASVQVMLDNGDTLSADFVVEARGRAAPQADFARSRGPQTLSLLQYWQSDSGVESVSERRSMAISLPDGWAWMAMLEDGRRYLQLTLDVTAAELPAKQQLAEYCQQRFLAISEAEAFTQNAKPVGVPHGRISTPVLVEECIGRNWIRVGDAAMAVDPLSGNGIFQALSSALQAPAVINTLIRQPENAELAARFYRDRVEGLFYRFARIGRDFYQLEERWQDAPFWQNRCQWPDAEPMHNTVRFDQLSVGTMPVVADGLIAEQEVVITPDQPLGIWHLAGIPLAPVVNKAKQLANRDAFDIWFADQQNCQSVGIQNPTQLNAVRGWLRSVGFGES